MSGQSNTLPELVREYVREELRGTYTLRLGTIVSLDSRNYRAVVELADDPGSVIDAVPVAVPFARDGVGDIQGVQAGDSGLLAFSQAPLDDVLRTRFRAGSGSGSGSSSAGGSNPVSDHRSHSVQDAVFLPAQLWYDDETVQPHAPGERVITHDSGTGIHILPEGTVAIDTPWGGRVELSDDPLPPPPDSALSNSVSGTGATETGLASQGTRAEVSPEEVAADPGVADIDLPRLLEASDLVRVRVHAGGRRSSSGAGAGPSSGGREGHYVRYSDLESETDVNPMDTEASEGDMLFSDPESGRLVPLDPGDIEPVAVVAADGVILNEPDDSADRVRDLSVTGNVEGTVAENRAENRVGTMGVVSAYTDNDNTQAQDTLEANQRWPPAGDGQGYVRLTNGDGGEITLHSGGVAIVPRDPDWGRPPRGVTLGRPTDPYRIDLARHRHLIDHGDGTASMTSAPIPEREVFELFLDSDRFATVRNGTSADLDTARVLYEEWRDWLEIESGRDLSDTSIEYDAAGRPIEPETDPQTGEPTGFDPLAWPHPEHVPTESEIRAFGHEAAGYGTNYGRYYGG